MMGIFKNILVHVDGRTDAHKLVACAVQLAGHHNAQLKLVDIIPKTSWPARLTTVSYHQFLDQLADSKQEHLRQLALKFQRDDLPIATRVLQSPTSLALIRECLRGEHDLVIKVAKGRESRRSGFFGTSAQRLLRKCPVPVLLLKPEAELPFQHVLAAVDATSEHAQDQQLNDVILQMAQSLCPDLSAPEVLHAWSLYGVSILKEHMRQDELLEALDKTELHARKCLEALAEKGSPAGRAPCVRHLVQGDPINVIPAFTAEHNTDLLVMGSIGRSGVSGLLMGNTAEQIFDRVGCSVLAVKPAGFTSPIQPTDEHDVGDAAARQQLAGGRV